MVFIADKDIQLQPDLDTIESLERALKNSIQDEIQEPQLKVKEPVTLRAFSFYSKLDVPLDEIETLEDRSIIGIYSQYDKELDIDVSDIMQAVIVLRHGDDSNDLEPIEVKLDQDIISFIEENYPGSTLNIIQVWNIIECKG